MNRMHCLVRFFGKLCWLVLWGGIWLVEFWTYLVLTLYSLILWIAYSLPACLVVAIGKEVRLFAVGIREELSRLHVRMELLRNWIH